MSSVLVGPAQRWDRLIMKVSEVESVDHLSFAILGIRWDGGQDTLQTNILASEDLSFISAAEYPHLKIIFKTADDLNLTSVQLAKWLVIYEPVAEGLIFYRGPVAQQVMFEGQTLSSDFGFINISDKTFPDSLTVRYNLLNYNNPVTLPSTTRISPPMPGDTTLFTIPFNTLEKVGLNDVEVFVNPRVAKEKSYDNNVMVLSEHLKVVADNAHPVMDVTFDGRYLVNNEFVSANPSIVIRLWDENPFIRKKDTLGIRIFLAFPCGSENCEFQPIHFSRDDINWQPATDTSDFKAHFSPRQLVNGSYVLHIEASDAMGNISGETPYEIGFRVEHEPSVSTESPYPNPFYLETNFDIMVTGGLNVPYFYKLQLTSLNGMRVTEFSDNTVGLHVGRNRITWDGFDKDGKSFPNGIYLYRLLINGNNQEREYHGKVVLIR